MAGPVPEATVQLIYLVSNDNGKKLVSDKRVAATGFTGSQKSGLVLKQAAEEVGNLAQMSGSAAN